MKRESQNDLLHQRENFAKANCILLTFSSLLLLSRQCKETDKNSCQRLDHDRIATKESATRLTPTRARAALTCELWQDWYSVTFSGLWSHHCEGSERTPATVSLSLTFRRCRKTSCRNYVLRLERKTRLRYYCILHRLCPILRCALGRHHWNQVKSFRQTKHTCCEKKAVEKERNNTRKLTYNCLDLWVPPLFLFDVLCWVLVLRVCHPEDSSACNCPKTL